jgi:RNA polymerase sigma-70 factor (ECF subfamily)
VKPEKGAGETVKSASVTWSGPSEATGDAGAAAGDRPFDAAGFRAFYEATARPLWAYLSRTATPDLADDLVQEAFYRLLRSDFVPESDAHAKNYLYRIATHLVRDHFRRVRRRRAAGEVDAGKEPGDPAGREPTAADAPGRRVRLRSDLRRFLDRLSPRDRRLLWLAHVEGASHREIAEVLEVGEPSVRVLVFRARRRLAAMLEEDGVGPEVMA